MTLLYFCRWLIVKEIKGGLGYFLATARPKKSLTPLGRSGFFKLLIGPIAFLLSIR